MRIWERSSAAGRIMCPRRPWYGSRTSGSSGGLTETFDGKRFQVDAAGTFVDQFPYETASACAKAETEHRVARSDHDIIIAFYAADIRQPICRTRAIAIPDLFAWRHRHIEIGVESFHRIEDALDPGITRRRGGRRDLHRTPETDLISIHRRYGGTALDQDSGIVDAIRSVFKGDRISTPCYQRQPDIQQRSHLPAPGARGDNDGVSVKGPIRGHNTFDRTPTLLKTPHFCPSHQLDTASPQQSDQPRHKFIGIQMR